jgi:hypothetical protein
LCLTRALKVYPFYDRRRDSVPAQSYFWQAVASNLLNWQEPNQPCPDRFSAEEAQVNDTSWVEASGATGYDPGTLLAVELRNVEFSGIGPVGCTI